MHAYVSSHDGQVSSGCVVAPSSRLLLTFTSANRAGALMSESYFVLRGPTAGHVLVAGPKVWPSQFRLRCVLLVKEALASTLVMSVGFLTG
jgi:hypothetical protein